MTQPRILFVDVDDTLVRSAGSKRIPMTPMIELVRELKKSGAELYCWSSGGAAYAEATARELGLEHCFTAYLPKPHVLIDDVAIARWDLREFHPNEALSRSTAELLLGNED